MKHRWIWIVGACFLLAQYFPRPALLKKELKQNGVHTHAVGAAGSVV
jgi:hypothetical protein